MPNPERISGFCSIYSTRINWSYFRDSLAGLQKISAELIACLKLTDFFCWNFLNIFSLRKSTADLWMIWTCHFSEFPKKSSKKINLSKSGLYSLRYSSFLLIRINPCSSWAIFEWTIFVSFFFFWEIISKNSLPSTAVSIFSSLHVSEFLFWYMSSFSSSENSPSMFLWARSILIRFFAWLMRLCWVGSMSFLRLSNSCIKIWTFG